ncbi:MAG: hypothetical protein M3R04_02115, partial [bacterium]|nr:hypothetical protein [bacterium]
VLILTACAILCAGCGAGGGLVPDAGRDTTGFSVNVLPESFATGGSASNVTATPRAEGDEMVVEVRGRAERLKAFYFELAYDTATWRPINVEQRLGPDGEVIQMAVTERPGRIHAGRILTRPQTRDGISGDLLLARIRFARANGGAGRRISTPPSRPSSAAILTISAAGLLEWKYESTGDYDQNRIVGIADMTPIAIQFDQTTGTGAPFPYDSIQSVVDGDKNGTITIAEISPISPNFGNELSAYRVYRSQDPADYPDSPTEAPALAEIGEVPYGDGVGEPTQVRLSYSFDVAALGGDDPANIFWVRPVDSAGTAGTASNQISPNVPGNQDPQISSFTGVPNPVISGGDVDLTVVAADPD